MTYTDMFYLVDAGQGRWQIKHHITDLLAGDIVRTAEGFLLTDEESRRAELFASIDEALREIYAAA